MSLTQDDLMSIKALIKPMLDELDENLSIRVAKGFAGVDNRFTKVDKKIDQVEENLSRQIADLSRRHDLILDQVHQQEVRVSKLGKQQA